MQANLPTVSLITPRKVKQPWIFQRNMVIPTERIPPGSIVNIQNPDGSFIGRGFYNGRARIGLRILTRNPAEIVDEDFFARRIKEAISWRHMLNVPNQASGYRLIYSEGDNLSGLIVDKFADILAIQFFSAGMFRQREVIKSILLREFPNSRVYWFADKRIQKQESFDCWDLPQPEPVTISENGVTFKVEVGSKHKTGFFADQRENRRLLSELTAGKKVLDLCCHTGGFSLYAKTIGRAESVTAIDLDEAEALSTARENAKLNNVDINFHAADVFQWLEKAHTQHDLYDVVILDPAKQTRSAEGIEQALLQYTAMNRLAMGVVRSGGVLLSCSCSGLITEDQFIGTIKRAARQAKRDVQIFRVSGAAPDHPVHIEVPEGRYLKAVWCIVR